MEHTVWVPALYRDLTGGAETVRVEGASVGEVVQRLEEQHPGVQARLCDQGALRPHIVVAVNGEVCRRGLRQQLQEPSEIHFIPAISGG